MKREVTSPTSGYVTAIDALEVGLASKILGAGRKTKDAAIDLSVGIYLNKKIGDYADAGKPLAVLYSDGDDQKIQAAKEKLLQAYVFSPQQIDPPKLFHARVTREGVEEM